MASPLEILPLPGSRFRPLAPYCRMSWHLTAKTPPQAGTLLLPPLAGTLLLLTSWHPTAHHHWLASPLPAGHARHLPFRSVGPSSVTPSRGIALPPWLLSNALDRCHDRTSWFWWAHYWSFTISPIIYLLHRALKGP